MSGLAPGFYGKAPALGDFVSRNLPPRFATAWDRCLADIVQSSRASLGAEWLAAWNEAPVWHFVLGPGIAGAATWAGVLIPSVDRVGRQFPFSIFGPVTPGGVAYPEWSLRAEALALEALEDGFEPTILVADLDQLGPPGLDGFDQAEPDVSVWCCRDMPRSSATSLRFIGLPTSPDAARLVP